MKHGIENKLYESKHKIEVKIEGVEAKISSMWETINKNKKVINEMSECIKGVQKLLEFQFSSK
jgi:peptidoglycan hydrolase CwlO-like protein